MPTVFRPMRNGSVDCDASEQIEEALATALPAAEVGGDAGGTLGDVSVEALQGLGVDQDIADVAALSTLQAKTYDWGSGCTGILFNGDVMCWTDYGTDFTNWRAVIYDFASNRVLGAHEVGDDAMPLEKIASGAAAGMPYFLTMPEFVNHLDDYDKVWLLKTDGSIAATISGFPEGCMTGWITTTHVWLVLGGDATDVTLRGIPIADLLATSGEYDVADAPTITVIMALGNYFYPVDSEFDGADAWMAVDALGGGRVYRISAAGAIVSSTSANAAISPTGLHLAFDRVWVYGDGPANVSSIWGFDIATFPLAPVLTVAFSPAASADFGRTNMLSSSDDSLYIGTWNATLPDAFYKVDPLTGAKSTVATGANINQTNIMAYGYDDLLWLGTGWTDDDVYSPYRFNPATDTIGAVLAVYTIQAVNLAALSVVTGSRSTATVAVLTSLLSKLAATGIITNNTTA